MRKRRTACPWDALNPSPTIASARPIGPNRFHPNQPLNANEAQPEKFSEISVVILASISAKPGTGMPPVMRLRRNPHPWEFALRL